MVSSLRGLGGTRMDVQTMQLSQMDCHVWPKAAGLLKMRRAVVTLVHPLGCSIRVFPTEYIS